MEQSLITAEDALLVAEHAIKQATRAGAAAAVAISAGNGLSVAVRNGKVEVLEQHRDKSLGITVYLGQRKGSATTTDFSQAAVTDTVAAAVNIAAAAEADPYAGLIDPALLAHDYPDLDLDHPWDLDAPAAIELALQAEAAARAGGPGIQQVDESAVSRYRGLRAYADTQGFRGAYRATRHGLSCTVVGAHEGAMQRGYWFSSARRAARPSPGTRALHAVPSRVGTKRARHSSARPATGSRPSKWCGATRPTQSCSTSRCLG